MSSGAWAYLEQLRRSTEQMLRRNRERDDEKKREDSRAQPSAPLQPLPPGERKVRIK